MLGKDGGKRYILLICLFTCALLLSLGHPTAAETTTTSDDLTRQGFEALYNGNPKQALEVWKKAEITYNQQDSLEGAIGSRVNQSLALQELGLYQQACALLSQSFNLSNLCEAQKTDLQALTQKISDIPTSPARTAGLNSLAESLREIGRLECAQIIVKHALRQNQDAAVAPKLLLTLGNIQRSLYAQTRDRYERTDNPSLQIELVDMLHKQAAESLESYGEVAKLARDSPVGQLAQVNRFALLSDLRQWQKSQNLPVFRQGFVQQEFPEPPSDFEALPLIQSVYARLSVAKSLQRLEKPGLGVQYASEAAKIAQRLQNSRVLSYTLGTLSELQLAQSQISAAIAGFQEAATLAQSAHAWDAAFRWHWKLGQTYRDQGNNQAGQEYETAIALLDQVTNDTTSNPEFQFSFQEAVEPVYREYLRWLLTKSQPDLQYIIRVHQQFKKVELENFLRCGRLEISPNDPPKDTTVFYILDIGQDIGVIIQDQQGHLHHYLVEANEIKAASRDLRINFQTQDFATLPESIFLAQSQLLYKQLLYPAQQKGYLPAPGNPLIFVLDSPIQSIPVAMLHDGDQYLIEKYSIATTLGLQYQPQKLAQRKPEVLIGGLSQIAPSFNLAISKFSALPVVEEEVTSIEKLTHATVLLNRNFTVSNFRRTLEQEKTPIVHLTSHGQFSSIPQETFILAWDKPILVRDLSQVVRKKTDTAQPIELLVLSACETAKGDRRATLGIAGMAAQAGARSTLASLWQVNAGSTAVLMTEFYKHLLAQESKAQALRSAQLTLLQTPEFSHPYYWAPFILTGG